MLKIFLSNINESDFKRSKSSLLTAIALPSLTMGAFNLLSPYSMFKSAAFYTSIFGTLGSFIYIISDDLDRIAHRR